MDDMPTQAPPAKRALIETGVGNVDCARCGYSLRGLDIGGNCPECGQPIAQTLDAALKMADPQWLRRQATTMLLLISVCLLDYTGPRYFMAQYLNWAMRMAIAVTAIIACWRLSTLDPRRVYSDGQAAAARGLRVCIIACAAGLAVLIPDWLLMLSNSLAGSLALGWLAALTLSSWLAFLIILHIARRSSDPSLIAHARISVWAVTISKLLTIGSPLLGFLVSNLGYESVLVRGVLEILVWATHLTTLVAIALLGRMHEVLLRTSKASHDPSSEPQ